MICDFVNGQGVHIGPQPNRTVAATRFQYTNDADTFIDLKSQLPQPLRNAGLGAMLSKAKLWLLVKLPSQRRQDFVKFAHRKIPIAPLNLPGTLQAGHQYPPLSQVISLLFFRSVIVFRIPRGKTPIHPQSLAAPRP
jgi:hypothetical protein